MSKDIEVTHKQVNVALRGILAQLSTTNLDVGFDSLAEAIWVNNMWDFLFNQAKVIASLHAFSTRDNKIIHKLTHRRS